MRNFILTFVVLSLLGATWQEAAAQSGSRNRVRRSRNTPTAEQRLQAQQQQQAAQNAQSQALRIQTLKNLASRRDGTDNRRQYNLAFNDAKQEFMAIKKKTIPVSGRRLNRLFVLKSKEVNRTKKTVKWPKELRESEHEDLVEEIETGLMESELSKEDFLKLLSDLSRQVEERVLSESIEIKGYANAKRFITGLANEAEI